MKRSFERLELAAKACPSILTEREKLDEAPGFTTEYLESLGLEKRDLKVLERAGFAIRARTKNIWVYGENLPNGKPVEQGSSYRGKGSELRWLLLKT